MSLKLTLQIVTWNSAADLQLLFASLKMVPQDNVAVRFIDNGSTDDSVTLITKYLPWADVVRVTHNNGYGEGHNIGFRLCETPFVATLNPDLVLFWDSFYSILDVFSDAKVGAVQGLLVRNNEGTIIDSAGIALTKSLNGKERGANTKLRTVTFKDNTIIAPTGACALYRLSALREVSYRDGEILDKDFFAYKEDVDLGWRLARHGWITKFVPEVIGRHRRGLKGQGKSGWSLQLHEIKHRLRDKRTYFSFRNWIWLIVKNASIGELIIHFPFIVGRILIMAILSVFNFSLIKLWKDAISKIPLMLDKRWYRN